MLTARDIDRAAETVCAIAAIPSLRDGIVTFDVDGLEGGWWYISDSWLDIGDLDRVWVPVPDTPDIAECRFKVETAVEDKRRVLASMISQLAMVCDSPETAGGAAELEENVQLFQQWIDGLELEDE